MDKIFYKILFLPVFLFIIFTTGLIFVQKPWEDEGMFASATYHLAYDGYMGVPEFEWHIWKGADKNVYFMPPLSMVVSAIWAKIIGFDIFRNRSFALIWGLVGLISFWHFLKFLKIPAKVIFLTLFLISVDFIYTRRSADGRVCDIMSAALCFLSYAVFLFLREKNFKLSLFWSNTFIMLAGLTHPNALIGLIGLIYLVLSFDYKKITLKCITISLTPYFIGGICYGLYIMKDFESFRAQFLGNVKQSIVSNFISEEIKHRYLFIYGGIGRNLPIYNRFLLLIPLLYFISLIYNGLKVKENNPTKIIFFLTLIYFISFVFYGKKTPGYLVYIIPFYSCCVSIMFAGIRNKYAKTIVGLWIFFILTSSIGVNIFRYRRNEYKKYLLDATKIKEMLSPTERVIAPIELGFGLGWENVMDDRSLGFFSKKEYNFLAVTENYKQAFLEQDFSKRPELYKHITNNFKKYELIWQGGIYKVYQKRKNG